MRGTGQQLFVPSEVGGRFDGVGHQVPAGDLAVRKTALLFQEADQIALVDLAQTPDGLHMALLVELEAVGVYGAVEVDRELRHPQQRTVDVDQPMRSVAQAQPSGDTEVAVEPAVEQRAAVDLDGDLSPAVRTCVGQRLDPQIG